MALHCTSSSILREMIRPHVQIKSLPPSFLLPAFTKTSSFSTSAPAHARKDGNTRRGMSPIKGTGLGKRYKVGVKLEDMPQPRRNPLAKARIETAPDHGLWGFFRADKERLSTPETLGQHGRAWQVSELRRKDFDDLWKLHWVCVREQNRVLTSNKERARLGLGYGAHEAGTRVTEIKKTMKAIKQALTERWYEFESARDLAMDDPEINLYADVAAGESPYNPIYQEQDAPTPKSAPRLNTPETAAKSMPTTDEAQKLPSTAEATV